MDKLFENIINILSDRRKDVIGLISALILETYLYVKYFNTINNVDFYCIKWWLPLIIFIITLLIWSIISVRLYIRDGWILLICMIICGIVAYTSSHFFLPKIFPEISDTIVLCATICFFISAGLLVLYLKSRMINKKKVLLVLFIKNNVSTKVERNIKNIIKRSVNNIEDKYDNVKIIVPPIGLYWKKKLCYRYLANPLTCGDVYVMAEVFDGDDETSPDYVFTQFYSQTNEKINYCKYIIPSNLLNNINSTIKNSDWQYRQINQNDIASKIRMSTNIETLLMLYVSSTFMIKNKFTDAISFVKRVQESESFNDNNIKKLSDTLLGDSYLFAAQNEEHEYHDYELAFNHLSDYASRFPLQKNNPMFIHAMARVLFYQGNISESKKYTRMLRNLKGDIYKWGYELNMGFYSICEGKDGEFVQHYKNLKKYESYGLQQIKFTIKFLKNELKNTSDTDKKVRLNYAIAYLYQYLSIKKAKALLSSTNLIFATNPTKEKMIKLREIILQSKENWSIGLAKK